MRCVRQGWKILGKFGGFSLVKQNKQGKEGQGTSLIRRRRFGTRLLWKSFALFQTSCHSSSSIVARGAEQEGRNTAQGSRGFFGPLRGLGIRPLVSVIRGVGNLFPEAP